MSLTAQEKDYKWYIDHLRDLYGQYGGVYVAIKNKSVLGVYGSYAEGVQATLLTEQAGTFIVQKLEPDESAYTAYINGAGSF